MRSLQKYGLIFLAFLLIFPVTVKSAHVFLEHEHIYCEHYSDSHFHKKNLDCELFKFQQLPFPSFETSNFQINIPETGKLQPISSYAFLNEHQQLAFALRGPPILA